MRKQEYWKQEALGFARYYSAFWLLSPKACVSKFLNARTNTVMSLIGFAKNKVVLDVGCGNGIHLERLLTQSKRVVGMDISKEMLDAAENRLYGQGKSNYMFYLADAEKRFPFEDNKFDIVMSIGLLDYVTPSKVLLECRRVLKDDGLVIFTIPKRPSIFFFLRGSLGNVIRKMLLGLPSIANALTRNELSCLIEGCGLESLHVKPLWTTMWIAKAKKSVRQEVHSSE